ncbi:MAG: O-methyltransferase [Candidatus Kapaibacterium sp.]|nr:MAG: O-methyltransferase [Candidatus Kapabacteria bacterium]
MKYTALTKPLHDYICATFPAEDDFLRRLKADGEAVGMPPIHIAPEQLAFVQTLLRGINARFVLEIGSLAGYSAIGMARALPEDGKVVCFEKEPTRAEFIRQKAEEAGIPHKIEVHAGDAKHLLENFRPEHEFDFVFIDAEKAGYVRYLELSLPLLRKGGMLCGDNTLAWGNVFDANSTDKTVQALRAFNHAISKHPELSGCLVPIGEGMTLAVKR